MESSSANGASDIYVRAWPCACVCVYVAQTHLHTRGRRAVLPSPTFSSPRAETVNQLKVMTVYLLFSHFPHLLLLLLLLSSPYRTYSLAHSVSLSYHFWVPPPFSFFFFSSSPRLLCFRSATPWSSRKAFYIPHITAQLQSIVFMSA